MTQKTTRSFTRADIAQFFQEHWGVIADPVYTLQDIQLLSGVTPPLWRVQYRAHYHTDDPSEDRYWTTIIIEHPKGVDGPWLNVLLGVDVPEGCATIAEEDAEMAQHKQAEQEERRRQYRAIMTKDNTAK